MNLKTGWKLYCFDEGSSNDTELKSLTYNDSNWYEAEVPGDVHSTLLKHNVIADPYFSTNDVRCQWIDKKEWWYRNVFEFSEKQAQNERIELTFEGLDTYGTIYLNGEAIGFSNNMFTPKTLDITDRINSGKNILAVKFHTIKEMTRDKSLNGMLVIFSDERQWTRKSAMNFGWDWGPKLVTVGIWKDVIIQKKKYAKLNNVFIKCKNMDLINNKAVLEIEADIENFTDKSGLSLIACFKYGNDVFSKEVIVNGNNVKLQLDMENARFWWPFDMGEPCLYQAEVVLRADGEDIDSYSTMYGIRDIKVKLYDEIYKTRFTFTVNGIEIFARGANWIPAHNFIGAIKDETYIGLVKLARDGNMNMLRVWGGGVYEKDIFYKECDRLGILVWQDFMFACSEYPDYDTEFMETVKAEIVSVVKRLRNHPSIAIWVGNNENQQIYASMDFGRPLYGLKIYEEMMPMLLKELDDTRFYWPGSAYGGDDPQSEEFGDRHNWTVWHGAIPTYKNYSSDKTRFCSEFGIHAAPVKFTMERNMPEGELEFGSFELDYRNKDLNPDKMLILMEGHTGRPKNIDEYIDYSMIVQAEGLKYAVEHYRRRFPVTSGAVIWQFNDCWPGQSWSMIDYYQYPKASYYWGRKFFSKVLLSFKEDDMEKFSIWVTNNSLEEYSDTITFGVNNFMGGEIHSETIEVNIPANSSRCIKSVNLGWLGPDIAVFQKRWLYAYVKPANPCVYGNEYFFKEFKDCKLPACCLSTEYRTIDGGLELEISTDNFARFVKIEYKLDWTELSDNYFNIYPGETRKVIIKNSKTPLAAAMFKVSAVNSAK